MGADERKSMLRKVGEALIMYHETEPPQNQLVVKYILNQLNATRDDTKRSAQALEDAGNLTQAIELGDKIGWIKSFDNCVNDEEVIRLLEVTHKDKLPAFKRHMLKKEEVFVNPAGTKDDTITMKLGMISVVETPPNPACVIEKVIPIDEFESTGVQLLEKPIPITLSKNIVVLVRVKNPLKPPVKKFIDIKHTILRGTKGEIVAIDTKRGQSLVELKMDNDVWPDAERLNNRVWISSKELRAPVKEVVRGSN